MMYASSRGNRQLCGPLVISSCLDIFDGWIIEPALSFIVEACRMLKQSCVHAARVTM